MDRMQIGNLITLGFFILLMVGQEAMAQSPYLQQCLSAQDNQYHECKVNCGNMYPVAEDPSGKKYNSCLRNCDRKLRENKADCRKDLK